MHAYARGPKHGRRMVSLLVDGLRYGATLIQNPRKPLVPKPLCNNSKAAGHEWQKRGEICQLVWSSNRIQRVFFGTQTALFPALAARAS